jgi:hypothetical protein
MFAVGIIWWWLLLGGVAFSESQTQTLYWSLDTGDNSGAVMVSDISTNNVSGDLEATIPRRLGNHTFYSGRGIALDGERQQLYVVNFRQYHAQFGDEGGVERFDLKTGRVEHWHVPFAGMSPTDKHSRAFTVAVDGAQRLLCVASLGYVATVLCGNIVESSAAGGAFATDLYEVARAGVNGVPSNALFYGLVLHCVELPCLLVLWMRPDASSAVDSTAWTGLYGFRVNRTTHVGAEFHHADIGGYYTQSVDGGLILSTFGCAMRSDGVGTNFLF